MIHEAYMPVYRCQDFHCVRMGVRVDQIWSEVVQEALADLKTVGISFKFHPQNLDQA